MREALRDTTPLATDRVRTLPCQKCQTIRAFVLLGGLMIIAIYLQPVWAQALAARMPDPIAIGVGLCVASFVVFLLRFAFERRAQTRDDPGKFAGNGPQGVALDAPKPN